MAQTTSIVQDDTEPDGDGMTLTRLAVALGEGQPLRCFEKTFYDGTETIPTLAIPRGVDDRSVPIYRRFAQIGHVNLARIIVDAAVSRQRINGFRLVNDKTMRSTAADDMYARSRMSVKAPKCFRDVGVHGRSYLYVTGPNDNNLVEHLSPWQCYATEDAACVYAYDEVNQVERLMLLRLVKDKDGGVSDVYVRTASRASEKRTLIRESDDPSVTDCAKTWSTDRPSVWNPSTDFQWEGAKQSLDYAVKCGRLPIFTVESPDGRSQLFPHFSSLQRIDQHLFDRMCIMAVQSFKQRALKGTLPTTYSADDPAVLNGWAEEGDPIDYSNQFETGFATMWMLPKDVDIWESENTDLTPYETILSGEVKRLAAASATPLDILSPDVAGSAEGASLKREGLVFKVEELNRLANDALVGALQMALVADGETGAAEERFETMWLPVELRSWTDISQAVSQGKGVFPVKTMWRKIAGFTEQEMAEAEQDLTDTAFQQALAAEASAMDSKTQAQSPGTLEGTLDSSSTLGDQSVPASFSDVGGDV
ncbi:hypothetical protein [Bifidobacterium olomucense]|uniref:Phage portal protein gp6 n=1 Tax=Bifidobacterium olomucense TaxID=2675324 RepID=A0A7Y0HXB2_9BIFI|nr:hypothetical protein [Bifidobacterium sp. DSM 109959]NMM98147.1 Phage portal protein gp6 [Bifidobacterium sp. DSM 109959]